MLHTCEHFARSSCILCIDVDDVFWQSSSDLKQLSDKKSRDQNKKTRDIKNPFGDSCETFSFTLAAHRQVYRVTIALILEIVGLAPAAEVVLGNCQTIPRYRLLRGLEFNNFFSEATALKERSQRKSWWQRYGPLVF